MADKDQEPQDQEMQDAPAEGQEFEFDGGIHNQTRTNVTSTFFQHDSKLQQLPGSTLTAASYEFTNEDHTLGNALRHIIMKK